MVNCGIYSIINTSNNKKYIGSSNDIKYRIARHFRLLKRNQHPNPKLQNAYNASQDCFEFKIIIACSEEKLRHYEQLCIDNLSPEYNISSDAFRPSLDAETRLKIANTVGEYGRSLGENHPSKRPEVRQKMSKALTGRIFTEEHKENLRISLNKDGRISPNKQHEKRNKHSNLLKSKGENHSSKRKDVRQKMKDFWKTDKGMFMLWYRANMQHQKYWGC